MPAEEDKCKHEADRKAKQSNNVQFSPLKLPTTQKDTFLVRHNLTRDMGVKQRLEPIQKRAFTLYQNNPPEISIYRCEHRAHSDIFQ